MKTRLNWGIIGCGAIAKAFAFGLSQTKTGVLLAAASRSAETAKKFAREHRVPRAYGGYQELLDDKDVDAVYICTPHPFHAEWTVRAADAGKHILCEKPFAVNYADAMTMVEAARRNDVFLMEAFMYRCHPQTQKLLELIREGVIGEVRMIQASFGFGGGVEVQSESRINSHALAGGGILDVGAYPVSLARLVAGVAQGLPFAEPVEIHGMGHIGAQSRVDEWAMAELKFQKNILAQVSTGIRVTLENKAVIFGSDGSITLPTPWVCDRTKPSRGQIIVQRQGKAAEEIILQTTVTTYAMEAELFAENIGRRQAPSPAMTWDDTLGNMRALDGWRKAIGLVYDADR